VCLHEPVIVYPAESFKDFGDMTTDGVRDWMASERVKDW
jgi:hypothetical protein